MLLNLIAFTIFILLTGFAYFVGQAIVRFQQDPLRARLAAASPAMASGQGESPETFVAGLAEQLPQTSMDNGKLSQELRRAGYYHRDSRNLYLAIRNGLVLSVIILTGLVCVTLGPEKEQAVIQVMVVGLLLAIVFWALPRFLLHIIGERRVSRIRNALPDALDMLTMSLTGGLSIEKGLEHVSREIYLAHPDIAIEFLIVKKQADMISLGAAFQRFGERIDTPEILSLSSLVMQGQRLGTDIARSLQDFADDLRNKRRQHANEQANKAVIKLLFPTVVCLLPAVFIVLWGPAVLELTDFLRNFEGASPNDVLP